MSNPPIRFLGAIFRLLQRAHQDVIAVVLGPTQIIRVSVGFRSRLHRLAIWESTFSCARIQISLPSFNNFCWFVCVALVGWGGSSGCRDMDVALIDRRIHRFVALIAFCIQYCHLILTNKHTLVLYAIVNFRSIGILTRSLGFEGREIKGETPSKENKTVRNYFLESPRRARSIGT